jgi:hypothetical protein
MYPQENFKEEMINSLSYSCVIILVIVIAYIIETQQKLAFYFLWQADSKAKWLSGILDYLNSGYVSINNGRIKYINTIFVNHLNKLKQNPLKFTEDRKEVRISEITNRRECKNFHFEKLNNIKIFYFYLAIIEVYSPTSYDKNSTTKCKEKIILSKLEENNFEEYNEIVINILKNMNSELLSI